MKKILYIFVLAVFMLTACGKAETDTKDKQQQSKEMDETEETSEGTTNDAEQTEDSQENESESSNVTQDKMDEDKVNNTKTESGSNTQTSTKPSEDSAEKPSGSSTEKPSGSSTEKPSGSSTEKPSGGSTEKPSGDSAEKPSTGNNSSNQSSTDSKLKAEADSNASKHMSYYQEVLRLVNEIRAEAGVGSLTLDMTLCKAASMRAVEMDYNNVMSHTRPNGSDFWSVLDSYGVSYSTCGENIAAGYRSAASVVNAWKNSPSHYENMVTPSFTKLGVGYSSAGIGDYGHYWCQLFTN